MYSLTDIFLSHFSSSTPKDLFNTCIRVHTCTHALRHTHHKVCKTSSTGGFIERKALILLTGVFLYILLIGMTS